MASIILLTGSTAYFDTMPLSAKTSLFFLLSLACVAVQAAGIDCPLASTPSERAICADDELRLLDRELADLYLQKIRDTELSKADIKKSQRAWIRQRDLCQEERACLVSAYRQRYDALQRQAINHLDATDMQNLQTLHTALLERMQTDKELALEYTLELFGVKDRLMIGDKVRPGPSVEVKLPERPPEGVSKAEWAAIRRVDLSGDSIPMGFALLDIDNDGSRELIIEWHEGGTGGARSFQIMSRRNAGYSPAGAPDDRVLYMLSRGNHARGYWLRINGRVYTAQVDGTYDAAKLFLIRPLTKDNLVPTLAIQYEYTFSLLAQQNNGVLRAAEQDALNQALQYLPPHQDSLCPAPAHLSEQQKTSYRWFGPPYQYYEVIKDVPIRKGSLCYVGRLLNWFARYDANNKLEAELWLRDPAKFSDTILEKYAVRGIRKIVNTSVGSEVVER